MKKSTNLNPQGLLLKIGHRPAGEAVIEGKAIQWNDADQLSILPKDDSSGKIRKYSIHPAHVERIYALLEDVYWGCFIELTISDRMVIDVTILSDWMTEYYANEINLV